MKNKITQLTSYTKTKKMNITQTYDVLSNWIVSSKTPEQLECVSNYIENVFRPMYPPSENPIHKEMITNLYLKIEKHDTQREN